MRLVLNVSPSDVATIGTALQKLAHDSEVLAPRCYDLLRILNNAILNNAMKGDNDVR